MIEAREVANLSAGQAESIRQRFHNSPDWKSLATAEPRFAEALAALPDESCMRRVNWMLWEMYVDARNEAVEKGGA